MTQRISHNARRLLSPLTFAIGTVCLTASVGSAQDPLPGTRSSAHSLHPTFLDLALPVEGHLFLPEAAPAAWEPLLEAVVAGRLGYRIDVAIGAGQNNVEDSIRVSSKVEGKGRLAVPADGEYPRLDSCYTKAETPGSDLQSWVWYPPADMSPRRQLECVLKITDRIWSVGDDSTTVPHLRGRDDGTRGLLAWAHEPKEAKARRERGDLSGTWAFDDGGVYEARPLDRSIRGTRVMNGEWTTPQGQALAVEGLIDESVPAFRVFRSGKDTSAEMFELVPAHRSSPAKAPVVVHLKKDTPSPWSLVVEEVMSDRHGAPVLVSKSSKPPRQLQRSEDSLLILLRFDTGRDRPQVTLRGNGWLVDSVEKALSRIPPPMGPVDLVDESDFNKPLEDGRVAVVRMPAGQAKQDDMLGALSLSWALLKSRQPPEVRWVGTQDGDEGILEWGGARRWAFANDKAFRAEPVSGAFGVFPGAGVDAEPQGTWFRGADRVVVAAGKVMRDRRAWHLHVRDSLEAEGLLRLDQVLGDTVVDLRYATVDNFLGTEVYPESAGCYMTPASSAALFKANEAIHARGLGFVIYDCYRPLSVQRKMWELVPIRGFVARPVGNGSSHNRATAIDLGLVDSLGRRLLMPTEHDDFSENAASAATRGIPQAAIDNRTLLKATMLQAGFTGIRTEWWHFVGPDASGSRAMDVDFPESRL